MNVIEFFTLPWTVHLFITLILGFCVLAQTLALLLSYFSYGLNTNKFKNNFFEIFILLLILVFSLLYGQMLNEYKNGFVVPIRYENPIGQALPWFFISVLIFFLARSIKVCIYSIIAIRTSISSLSVIHAINTLHTGVLFSEDDGHILLSNYQMQNLMIAITGKVFRNAKQFYEVLISDKYESRYKKAELDGKIVYLLEDKTAWMFTKTDIQFMMKNHIHISVADVSNLWDMTVKLQIKEQELIQKSEEIKDRIANLHILSKEKEIENAKIRAHDILGQRLTVLLRIIQNESNPDYELLKSLSKGLLAELKAEQREVGAYDQVKSIQQIFAAIGVEINFEGELPNDTCKALLFVDIIRESATNAVRHGFATQVNIKVELIENEYKLTIKNNGHTTTRPSNLGTGIKVMKKKVFAQGGNFNITYQPCFTLSIVLPGGD